MSKDCYRMVRHSYGKTIVSLIRQWSENAYRVALLDSAQTMVRQRCVQKMIRQQSTDCQTMVGQQPSNGQTVDRQWAENGQIMVSEGLDNGQTIFRQWFGQIMDRQWLSQWYGQTMVQKYLGQTMVSQYLAQTMVGEWLDNDYQQCAQAMARQCLNTALVRQWSL